MMDITELCKKYRAGKRFKYLYFWGHKQNLPTPEITKACLSQWFASSFKVDGVYYPTAEHYMMAAKAKLFEDEQVLAEILKAKSPSLAKSLGRKIKGFDVAIWNEHRSSIVIAGNVAKFSQNKRLAEFLLSTKQKILVEASPVDKIWGIGLAENTSNIDNPLTWRGKNLLGFALMAVRQQLHESN